MYRNFAPRILTVAKQGELQTVYTAFCRNKAGIAYPAVNVTDTLTGVQHDQGANNDVLDLHDYKKAYAYRTTWQIARAMFVFKLCSYQIFVKNSLKLMEVGQKVLGQRLFTKVMNSTVGGQFVGGQTPDELLKTVAELQKADIGPMLFVPVEEDVGNTEYRRELYEENLQALLQCVSLARQIDQPFPMSQMKLTALVPGNIIASLSTIILKADKEHAYLDNIIRVLEGGDLDLDGLTPEEHHALHDSLKRVKVIGEHVEKLRVRLLVDAEYTYLNPALRLISIAMMVRYNKQRPLVAYTYQNYLKETHDQVRVDEMLVRSQGACFGAKLVRGAYMGPERRRAAELGYPDPVHDSFEGTSRMYEQSVDYLLDKISLEASRYHVMVASHNQDTVQNTLKLMKMKGISGSDGSVVFGQIFGMSDHLTNAISQAGQLVYKSIPYGPLDACLPYLQRRAVENSTLLGATVKERQLLWRALTDRFKDSISQNSIAH